MKKLIAVLTFPGNNCEVETARAIREAGFDSKIFRWNDDPNEIRESDGLIIPGGFSFEDRGRTGVISAADPVLDVVWEMAKEGKPILGICNGAQILVESGLVPGFTKKTPCMGLSRNRRQKTDDEIETGFYHDFVFLTPGKRKCAWTHFEGVIRVPIANGEGRFLAENDVALAIKENGQEVMYYCDAEGEKNPNFPVNPNDSSHNLAAVSNIEGNVMAMMPHPERSSDGQKVFRSLHTFFEEDLPAFERKVLPVPVFQKEILPKKEYNIEMYISLKITDTTEKTLEMSSQRVFQKPNLELTRQVFWGISLNTSDFLDSTRDLLKSEEFFNENKESAILKIKGVWYKVKEGDLEEIEVPSFLSSPTILASEKDDILGEEKSEILKKHSHISAEVHSGVVWSFSEKIDDQKLLDSTLFGNPVAWVIEKV